MLTAELILLYHINQHVAADVKPVMAGNSIHFDRSFIRRHMPLLHERLHYRLVDVSTIKELARRWYPEAEKYAPKKSDSKHRAMDDILASIEELRLYRARFFVSVHKPTCPVEEIGFSGGEHTADLCGNVLPCAKHGVVFRP